MSETKTTPKPGPRIERTARLRWVSLARIAVSDRAQRDVKSSRVDYLVAHFDHEQIGAPVVNERGGKFWVIDGQHRIAALREVYGDDHQVQCWVYVGLSEDEEVEKFLQINDVLSVSAMDKYQIGVEAGREIEADIDRIVRARYNGELADELAVTKFRNMRGGVNGLLGKAAVIKDRTRQPFNQCVAAAAVEVINSGKGGKKLPGWWKSEAA